MILYRLLTVKLEGKSEVKSEGMEGGVGVCTRTRVRFSYASERSLDP